MASGPITSWQIERAKVETMTDFILGGSKITADSDCSHEIKRRLLLGRNAMINLDSIIKRRDITLLTKVCIVKAMIFPVVMCGCDSCTIKKANSKRIDAFKSGCCDCLNCKEIKSVNRKGNQPWRVTGRTDAEAPILWPPDAKSWGHWKRPWCWEGLRAGGEGGDRGWDGWMASPTQWTWVWASSGRWWWTGRTGVLQSMRSQRVGHDLVTEQVKMR